MMMIYDDSHEIDDEDDDKDNEEDDHLWLCDENIINLPVLKK